MRNIKDIVIFLREKITEGYTYDFMKDFAQRMPEGKGFHITDETILMYVSEGIIVYSYGRINYYLAQED